VVHNYRPCSRLPYRSESLSDNVSPQVGSLPKNDIDVGTGLVGAPAYVFCRRPPSSSSNCSSSSSNQVRGCNEVTNQSRRGRCHLRRQVQNLWLWECHCLEFVHDRACQGSVVGRGGKDKKHRDRKGAVLATRQAPLFKCVLPENLFHLDGLLTGFSCLAVLAEDAIRSAIRDYKKKREGLENPKQRGFIDVTQSPVTGETHATAHPGAA